MGQVRQTGTLVVRAVNTLAAVSFHLTSAGPLVVVVPYLDGTTALLCGDLVIVEDRGSRPGNERAAKAVLAVSKA